jgi:hypothetical protein
MCYREFKSGEIDNDVNKPGFMCLETCNKGQMPYVSINGIPAHTLSHLVMKPRSGFLFLEAYE